MLMMNDLIYVKQVRLKKYSIPFPPLSPMVSEEQFGLFILKW